MTNNLNSLATSIVEDNSIISIIFIGVFLGMVTTVRLRYNMWRLLESSRIVEDPDLENVDFTTSDPSLICWPNGNNYMPNFDDIPALNGPLDQNIERIVQSYLNLSVPLVEKPQTEEGIVNVLMEFFTNSGEYNFPIFLRYYDSLRTELSLGIPSLDYNDFLQVFDSYDQHDTPRGMYESAIEILTKLDFDLVHSFLMTTFTSLDLSPFDPRSCAAACFIYFAIQENVTFEVIRYYKSLTEIRDSDHPMVVREKRHANIWSWFAQKFSIQCFLFINFFKTRWKPDDPSYSIFWNSVFEIGEESASMQVIIERIEKNSRFWIKNINISDWYYENNDIRMAIDNWFDTYFEKFQSSSSLRAGI